MSYIDELRERFQAAEQRFGQINEAGREYRDRLMGLISRIEEEIRCRRDVEQQQVKEIERLSGEVDRVSGENEQLRTMMMSLLTAVEDGDTDILGDTLNDMDSKVATLIGEGQGASAAPAPADPADVATDTGTEFADDLADESEEEETFASPSFPAGDMMSLPGDEPPFSGDDADIDHDEESESAEVVAEDVPEAEEGDAALALDETPSADTAAPAISDPLAAEEPAQAGSDGSGASDMAEFYGAQDRADEGGVPEYSHAVAGWEDFLDDDGMSAEASTSSNEDKETLTEVSADYVAENISDPEAGSIHDLIDRVKTEVDGEDDAGDAAATDQSGEDDDNGDKAAAQ